MMPHTLIDLGAGGALSLMILSTVFRYMKARNGGNPIEKLSDRVIGQGERLAHVETALESVHHQLNRQDTKLDKIIERVS